MIPTEFWITFACFGIVGIPFMLFFISCGANAKNKIGGCIIVLVFWLMMSGSLYSQEKGNDERWNDGYCTCGTHWDLSGASKSRHETETKYYSCPNCHAEIEIIH